jgi:hypothetical protein
VIVGGYELHLYCDGAGCRNGLYRRHPANSEYTGSESRAQAWKQARADGWRLMKDGRCLCTRCRAKGAKLSDESQENAQ